MSSTWVPRCQIAAHSQTIASVVTCRAGPRLSCPPQSPQTASEHPTGAEGMDTVARVGLVCGLTFDLLGSSILHCFFPNLTVALRTSEKASENSILDPADSTSLDMVAYVWSVSSRFGAKVFSLSERSLPTQRKNMQKQCPI